jgi:outer membrane lipoprotein-sorting protein
LCLVLSACAARRITLPSDPGAPLPDFNQIHNQASAACAGVRTLTAELGLAGRAGAQRLRGRVVAGFERPDSMRLEGVAPFGPPAFILVSRGTTATLLLPRDNDVLRGARADEILGALTGVTLAPADLQAILTGCVSPMPRPIAGRLHQNGWASIDLDGGATIYLQRQGAVWQVRAARRAGWQIEYPAWQGMFPQTVRLRSDAQGPAVDLSATVSQLDTNVTLDAAAFSVEVPRDAAQLTLEELRERGPLGQ